MSPPTPRAVCSAAFAATTVPGIDVRSHAARGCRSARQDVSNAARASTCVRVARCAGKRSRDALFDHWQRRGGCDGCRDDSTIRSGWGSGDCFGRKTPMYSRPGLAYVLTGDIPPQQVVARTEHWYTDQRLKLVYGRAAALDTSNRLVTLNGGQTLPYDRLLIFTGAAAVPAPYPGGDPTASSFSIRWKVCAISSRKFAHAALWSSVAASRH